MLKQTILGRCSFKYTVLEENGEALLQANKINIILTSNL
jgi:hypothetical protein